MVILFFIFWSLSGQASDCPSDYGHFSGAFAPPPAAQSLGYGYAFDRYPGFDYSTVKSALLLADGGKAKVSELRRKFQSTRFIATDINPKPEIDMIADINSLPIKSHSQDLVIMNRGLCRCKDTKWSCTSCGGVDLKPEKMKSFLAEVTRVLDLTNPRSVALLTGFQYKGVFGPAAQIPIDWMAAARKLQAEHPELRVTLLYAPNTGLSPGYKNISAIENLPENFIGIALAPADSIELGVRLKELSPDFFREAR